MVRIGEEIVQKVSSREGCLPMDFTGRPMKGYIFVEPSGYYLDEDLNFWIVHCDQLVLNHWIYKFGKSGN